MARCCAPWWCSTDVRPGGPNGTPRIERVRTNGTFSIDGEDFDVENNVWLIGDDTEVIVVDAAHEADPIADGRR